MANNPAFTYKKNMMAHLGEGYAIVPDQVAEDQKGHDGKRFPAYRCDMCGRLTQGNKPVLVELDGESYGLHTGGVGDMRVKLVKFAPKHKFGMKP